MKKIIFSLAFSLFCAVSIVSAQLRPVEKPTVKTAPQTSAPVSFEAKYEGGMFGYSDKVKGILKFDDDNERLVFLDNANKEHFSIPYASILVVAPNEKKVQ